MRGLKPFLPTRDHEGKQVPEDNHGVGGDQARREHEDSRGVPPVHFPEQKGDEHPTHQFEQNEVVVPDPELQEGIGFKAEPPPDQKVRYHPIGNDKAG